MPSYARIFAPVDEFATVKSATHSFRILRGVALLDGLLQMTFICFDRLPYLR